ncbi:MAG: DnaJ domain-containing protein [Pirellulales bacterium]
MATAKRDYYEVLGVPRDAGEEAIKAVYRKLALQYQPDRNKDPEAAQHFKEITEAFAGLSDPRKRTRYDAHGHAGIEGFSSEDLFGGLARLCETAHIARRVARFFLENVETLSWYATCSILNFGGRLAKSAHCRKRSDR